MLRAKRLSVVVIGFILTGCTAETQSIKDKLMHDPLIATDKAVVVSLSALQTSVAKGEAFKVLFTVTNHTDKDFTILPWATPLEPVLSADSFEVSYNDTVLPYVGRVVKRMPPVESDYLKIAAGDTKVATVNLSNGYELDAAGRYQVQLRTEEGNYRAQSHLLPVTSKPLVIERR